MRRLQLAGHCGRNKTEPYSVKIHVGDIHSWKEKRAKQRKSYTKLFCENEQSTFVEPVRQCSGRPTVGDGGDVT